MKTAKEYRKELSTLDGIRKCVLRYASYVSVDSDETTSEWCVDYLSYLDKRYRKIRKKLRKIEEQGSD